MPTLTLLEKYNLSQDLIFKSQVASAMLNQAAVVLTTAPEATKPYSRFVKLQTYARSIVQNPSIYIDAFSFASAVKGSFASAIVATDSEVTNIVTAVFPYLAGIEFHEI